MIGHFPEGVRVRESLACSRASGIGFDAAWNVAMQEAHLRANGVPLSSRRAEIAEALVFARKAFRRAYEGQERTREDVTAGNLLKAIEYMLDDSSDAELRQYEDLMAA